MDVEMLIAGELVAGTERLAVLDPFREEVIATVPRAGAQIGRAHV